MTVIDDLLRVYAEGYNAGFAAGRASVLGGAHREGESDGPGGGVSWERIARHCESHPELLSPWEREMADSVLCSLYFKVPLTPKQRMKMTWIFANRFNGKLN